MSEIDLITDTNGNLIESHIWKVAKCEIETMPTRIIFNMFQQRQANLRAIRAHKGKDFGKQPHDGSRKKFKTFDIVDENEGSEKESLKIKDFIFLFLVDKRS